MPTNAECMSLVCRMVKVFFPSAAAATVGGRTIVALAAEPARNARRLSARIAVGMVGAYFCGLPKPWFSIGLPSLSLDMTSSRLKLAAFWRCGYSLKRRQELADIVLRGNHQEDVIHQPVVIGVRGDVGALVRIGAQVEDLGNPQVDERLRPQGQRARDLLLQEHELPVVVAQRRQLLVVVEVEERLARALRRLPRQVGHEIVAVEMDLVGHVADLVALEQLVLHVGVAGRWPRASAASRDGRRFRWRPGPA